jgi:DNA-binding transcriptional LysR family regulator
MAALDDWRMFIAVATKRSFVGAARALGRSPQVATRAVASLERRLSTRLLNRTTRSVSLTDDGERYLEQGRRVLAEFDRLESPPGADAPLSGRLSVTAPVLFGQQHVTPLVVQFLMQQPQVVVRLGLLDRVVSLAEEGVDVAVRIGELMDSSMNALRVGLVRSVLCASPAYWRRSSFPRTPADLAKHACIAFLGTTPNPDRWAFPRSGARSQVIAVRPRLVVNTGQAAINAALAGLGVVRVLSYQIDGHLAKKTLQVALADFEFPPLPVHLLRLPGLQSRVAHAFAELAAGRLRQVLGRDSSPRRRA